MTTAQTGRAKVQKLEALLDRVLTRAAEPRSAAVTVAAPVAAMQQLSTATTRMEAPAFAEPPPARQQETEPPATAAEPEMYNDDDVEVSSEVVEVDIDVDDPMLQSGAHEVVANRAAEEERPDTHRSVAPPPPNDEATVMVTGGQDEETAMVAPPANEVYEPEPSSSPRPIEESSPRHTPPPESGKQVAAPSAPPQRKSSVPPPSLEGHTLVGGWREPGLAPQQTPQMGAPLGQGVRVPPPPGAHAPPLAPPTPPPPPMPVAAPPVPQASGTRLSPEVTKPELPARANVASVQGTVEVPKPANFGALVDASLDL